jgi:hypothetical protein
MDSTGTVPVHKIVAFRPIIYRHDFRRLDSSSINGSAHVHRVSVVLGIE